MKVSRLSLLGDAQNDKKHHGGSEQAVCIYALERIHALQQEGHPIDVGTAGENVTVEGIDWLHPGWSRVYARVLTEGEIRFGDHVEVIPTTE